MTSFIGWGVQLASPGFIPTDTDPPTVPTGLSASAITTNGVTLSWTGSTDTGTGVAGYNLYNNGDFFKSLHSTATTVTLTTLTPGTPYSFTLTAWDAAGPPGNESAQSDPLVVTTTAVGDTTPPTDVVGRVATNITASSITLAWAASTDDVGVDHYLVYDAGVLVALPTITGTSVTVGGLAANSTHTYTITAVDAAGNESTQQATPLTVTTSATSSAFSSLGVVGSGAVTTATSTLVVHATKAVATGSTVLAAIACAGSATGITVVDSKGNTWVTDVEVANTAASGGNMAVAICRGTIATALTTSDTFTVTAPAGGIAAEFMGYVGVLSSPKDKTATSATSGSSVTSGTSGTLTQADELAFAAFSLFALNKYVPASGWTLGGSVASTGGTSQRYVAAATQVLSATPAVAATGTQNLVSGGTLVVNNYAAAIATYKISVSAGSAPVNTVVPALSGTAQQGSVMTSSTGSWSGSPTGYAYQWFRSPSTGIAGATSGSYTLTAADVGKTVYCIVTASNAAGSTAANSNASAVVTTSSTNVSATLVPKTGAWLAVTSTTSSGATGPTWTGTTQFESQVLKGQRSVDASYVYCVQSATTGGQSPSGAASYCNSAIAAGVIPNIGINPQGSGTFKTIAAGNYDAEIIRWAKALAAVKGKIFVTWGHESDRYLKAGTSSLVQGCVATDFAAAWIHFWTVMAANGATNCVRVLDFASPTAKVSGNAGFYVDGMYPGKQWVDWICADPYKDHGAQSSDTVLTTWTRVIGFLQQSTRAWAADGLPYGIIETSIDLASERTAMGESGGFTDPVAVSWYQGWPAAAKALNLKMVTMFNLTKATDISYGYLNNNATVSNAFAAMAADTYFNQPHDNTPSAPAPYLGISNPAPGSNNLSSATTYLGVNKDPAAQVYLDRCLNSGDTWASKMISNFYVNQVSLTNCLKAIVSIPALVGRQPATTLSATLSTSAITSLPVAALSGFNATGGLASGTLIPSGTKIAIGSDYFTTSANVAVGATSIPINSQTPSSAWASGANVLAVGLTISPNAPDGTVAPTIMTLAAVAAGTWDSLFGQAIQTIANVRPDAYLRFGWEAYGANWYPWNGSGAGTNFKNAYTHFVTLAATYSASFQFIWDGGAVVNGYDMMTTQYPGDGFVDLVGADTYNIGSGGSSGWTSSSNSGATFLAEGLAFARAHGKKYAVPEIGVNATDDSAWMSAALDWLITNEDVVSFMLYFNYPSSVLSSNPNTAALMKSKGGPIAAAALAQG